MVFNLSEHGLQLLSSCHPDLVNLVTTVSKAFPCIVICGHRDQAEQELAVASGHSKTPWPTSKHNKYPSLAVDLAPMPYDPADTKRLRVFAGFVLGVASQMGLHVRWGGNFSGDLMMQDKFQDLYHFEVNH